jgi:hypothetical protein
MGLTKRKDRGTYLVEFFVTDDRKTLKLANKGDGKLKRWTVGSLGVRAVEARSSATPETIHVGCVQRRPTVRRTAEAGMARRGHAAKGIQAQGDQEQREPPSPNDARGSRCIHSYGRVGDSIRRESSYTRASLLRTYERATLPHAGERGYKPRGLEDFTSMTSGIPPQPTCDGPEWIP